MNMKQLASIKNKTALHNHINAESKSLSSEFLSAIESIEKIPNDLSGVNISTTINEKLWDYMPQMNIYFTGDTFKTIFKINFINSMIKKLGTFIVDIYTISEFEKLLENNAELIIFYGGAYHSKVYYDYLRTVYSVIK